jgi:signal transduction histidine kinase
MALLPLYAFSRPERQETVPRPCAEQLSWLRRVLRAAGLVGRIATTADLDRIAQSVAEHLQRTLQCDATSCFIYDAQTNEVRFPPKLVGVYEPELVYQRGSIARDSIVYRVIHELPQPYYLTHNAQKDPLLGSDFVRREGFQTTVCFRLEVKQRVVGALFINYRHPHRVLADELSVMRLFAVHAATALDNALQHEQDNVEQERILARVTQRWLGLINGSWKHEISKHAVTITYEVAALRRLLSSARLNQVILEKLEKVERLARTIADEPLTLPLSYEEGVESILLNDILTERLRQLWERPAYHAVALRQDFRLPADATIRANADWFKVVLDSLVENAITAMAEVATPRLTVTTTQTGQWAKVVFADTGAGIPADVRAKLLREPIPKVQGETGSGIGLLLAQMIVRTYDGRLDLEETGPLGTKIALLLPLETATWTVA